MGALAVATAAIEKNTKKQEAKNMANSLEVKNSVEETAIILAANMDGTIKEAEKKVAADSSSADVNLLVAKLNEQAGKQEV